MNKYNNSYSRSLAPGESSMSFNKRPRYGANNSPRFSQSNQTPYKYQQNRHNSSPSSGQYQHTQYEHSPRNYYGHGSTKRPLHKQQQSNFEKQKNQPSLPYSNVSRPITASSTLPVVAATTTIAKTLPQELQTTPKSADMAQSNKQQNSTTNDPQTMPDQMFSYNNYFYPNYNKDATESTTTSPYGMNYNMNMSHFMWQTITSTPPPHLLHQPPLPQQSPPTQLPPLPGADMAPPLQPPPVPFPSLLQFSSSATIDHKENGKDSSHCSVSNPVVKIKVKRKAMSARYNTFRKWSQEDAELALKAEEDITSNQHNDTILILRFPDPEVNREIVKSYDPAIASVHFQLNFASRYCFIHLKPGSDVNQTIETLSKIPFGSGFLTAEVKNLNNKARQARPCDIDPCTLYVGNLPTTIACTVLKEHFPGASRIDIGFAQRMKYTRYAFIRYPNVQLAIEAYKRMSRAEIGGRSLLLRFRRTGTTKENQKDDAEHPEDLPGDEDSIYDLQSDSTAITGVAEKDSSIQLSQNLTDITDSIGHLENRIQTESEAQTSSTKTNNASKDSSKLKDVADLNTNTDVDNNVENHAIRKIIPNNVSNQQNEAETIAHNSNISLVNPEQPSSSSEKTPVNNIKPEPDIDPDDKVVGDDTITSRFDCNDHRVKQEKELIPDFEFFVPAYDQLGGQTRNTIMNEITSLSTTSDDCDETTDTASSLSEFLRTCQREDRPNDDDADGTPATKRAKTLKTFLENEIKNEPLDNSMIHSTQKSIVGTTAIKQEFNTMNEDLNNKSMDDICNVDKDVPSRLEISAISKRNSKNMPNLKRQNPNAITDAWVEKEMHLNNNNNKISNTMQNSHKHKSQNLLTDNDDLVPPGALFLRSDSESSTTVTANELYDEEFFATQSQTLPKSTITPLVEIKREALGRPIDLNSKKNNTAYQKTNNTSFSQQEKLTNQSPNSTEKINFMSTNFSNDLKQQSICSDDDDLVPENNCLLSRQSSSQMGLNTTATVSTLEIKLEKEFDDLFSTPFKKSYHERLSDISTHKDRQLLNNNNNNDFSDDSADNVNLNVNKYENLSDNSATDTLKAKNFAQTSQNSLTNSQVSNKVATEYDELSDEDDDDLIIISENFPQISKASVTTSSAKCNYPGQSELLTFKNIPAPQTNHNVKSSYATIHDSSRKLPHYDNLDKLFQQLDSDSDSEL